MTKLTLKDLDLKRKKVLVRVDFNIPLDEKGNITDDTRIKATIPTIQYILDKGGSVILMSHLGRPKNKELKLSLAPVAKKLSEILGKKVVMVDDCIGNEVEQKIKEIKPGEIVLLENLRFYKAEEKPNEDPEFAKKLAALGDVYVNDAFGTAHRAHSSTAEIIKYFPNKSAMGFLLEKEVSILEKLLKNPEKPFYAILGGAKISTKIGLVKSLLTKVDGIFVGGGMAFTFLKALQYKIGQSLCEDSLLSEAKEIIEMAEKNHVPIYLPIDFLIAKEIKEKSETKVVSVEEGIPDDFKGVDIGPKTIEKYSTLLMNAKTIFWNGPMGVFEISSFSKGTFALANTLASLKKATTVVGGGESVAAINAKGLDKEITHLSTGGGATLEYIEYGILPGINSLSNK